MNLIFSQARSLNGFGDCNCNCNCKATAIIVRLEWKDLITVKKSNDA